MTDENILNHPGVIQLPGNPQSLAVVQENGVSPKVVVALDPGSETPAMTINVFSLTMNENRLSVDTISHVEEDAVDTPDLEMGEKEIHNLLYNIEHLRKQKEVGQEEDTEDILEEELTGQEVSEQ